MLEVVWTQGRVEGMAAVGGLEPQEAQVDNPVAGNHLPAGQVQKTGEAGGRDQ